MRAPFPSLGRFRAAVVVAHTAATYESITATAIYYLIVASVLQSQGTTVTIVSQRYALKAKYPRLMSGGAALDMHMKLSAGSTALLH